MSRQFLLIETAIAISTRLMLGETAIAGSTGRNCDPLTGIEYLIEMIDCSVMRQFQANQQTYNLNQPF